MRYALIIPFCLSFSLASPMALSAPVEDEGWVESLLEDTLSDENFQLEIQGMEGAFSSTAKMDRMSFSDPDGEWLVLEDAVLDWTRSALAAGRLQVNELSAKKIHLIRLPKEQPKEHPGPEATGGALPSIPDLPVAIDLGKIAAKKVVLGESIAGEEIEIAIFGSMSLEGGGGAAQMHILRLDADAEFSLKAGYKPDTGDLSMHLIAREAKGGLVSRTIGLPTTQDILLKVSGNAPVDDFTADVDLSTGGQDRLKGSIKLHRDPEDAELASQDRKLLFEADIGGDLTPALPEELHPFFGENAQMYARGKRAAGGALSIERLDLTSAAMDIKGRAIFDERRRPEDLDLDIEIDAPGSSKVLLPFTEGRTKVANAQLELEYDRAAGEDWSVTGNIEGFQSPQLHIGSVTLNGEGTLDTAGQPAISGFLNLSAREFFPIDPKLAQATGSKLKSSISFDWEKGSPIKIDRIAASGLDYGISGFLKIKNIRPGETPTIDADFALTAARLSRFSGVAGRPLSGSAGVDISAKGNPLGGDIEIDVTGTTNDLSIDQKVADAIFAGRGDLTLAVKRDTTGTHLEEFRVTTPKGHVTSHGHLAEASGELETQVRLTDSTAVLEGLTGATELDMTAKRGTGPWALDGQLSGPGGLALRLEGSASRLGKEVLASLDGVAPMGLINPIIAPRRLDGIANINLQIDGAPNLENLTGTVNTQNANLALPTIRLALRDLSGQMDIQGKEVFVDLSGEHSTGGRANATGTILLDKFLNASLQFELNRVRKTNPELFDTRFNGTIALNGSLLKGGIITGKLNLDETNIRVPDRIDTEHDKMPGLKHEAEPSHVFETRKRAGITRRELKGPKKKVIHHLNVLLSAPSQIFVRGRGLDAELSGSLRLRGDIERIIPEGSFTLERGRLDFLGKRLNLTEGYTQLRGNLDPYIRFVAEADTEDGTARIELEGLASSPNLTFSSNPELPEDEVLSLLLFGKSISEISPLQAISLGAAVRELTTGKEGIISSVRNVLDLDDLTIETGEGDAAQIGFGKHLTEGVYTEATVSSEGDTRVNLNLSLTKSLKVQGHTESEGTRGIGLIFEKDY